MIQKADTRWIQKAKWGVFCHYLGTVPSEATNCELSASEWNERVDSFNVDRLASLLADMNAGYFCITVGQNTGHYCAPNETYDELVGISPSLCSKRDLISDLSDALSKKGIPLLVYLPSGAPAACPQAVEKLGWRWGFEGSWPHSWGTPRTMDRLKDFQFKWEAIIRDWSLRWGKKVRGWWIDGCYFADEMYRFPDAPNFESFSAAIKAGNPDSLVAFNPGVMVPVICHTEVEEFTAGEIDNAFPYCFGPMIGTTLYHILSYLGTSWCEGLNLRFPDEFVIGYTKHIIEKGGIITWDAPITTDGDIPRPFVEQLMKIGKAL